MKTVLIAMLSASMIISTTGCTVTAAQISSDGQTVANALLAIAKLEAVADPSLAANLTSAANALIAATANWTSGSGLAIFNDAAQVAEAALAAIPQTAIIAPLIPIAVAALDILIADISSGSVGLSANVNPYRGKAQIHHRFLRSPEGDFKAAWNTVVNAHPDLAPAEIK